MTLALRTESDERLIVILPPCAIKGIVERALQQTARVLGLTFCHEVLAASNIDNLADSDLVICNDAGQYHQIIGKRIVILPSEEPEEAAKALMDSSGFSARDALILVSRCYQAASAEAASGALSFRTADFLDRPFATSEALFHALGISAPESVLAEICEELEVAAKVSRTQTAKQAVPYPLRGALTMYDKNGGLKVAEAWWDRSLFRWGDKPEMECPETIDLTGPARMLAFGPFITLPVGRWRVELHFDICEDAARRFYLVEFGTGPELSRHGFRLNQDQGNVSSVEHEFTRAAPAEVRFWVARAAFHGHLCFRGARISSCR